jgi:hypothetical protein
MYHFNNLPDEMIANIFRTFLLIDKADRLKIYLQLHLVCRRWYSVCVSWAEHLPKYEERLWVQLTYDSYYLYRKERTGRIVFTDKIVQCTNHDGPSGRPKLINVFRDPNPKIRGGSEIPKIWQNKVFLGGNSKKIKILA